MYPRNAASPEPIAIGAVVQISDGAVQTSGCTVRIKPIGVAEADGGGTTAYSTDGIVLYTPTQAETNYTSFILIAKKTGCIPACVTVVTTASSVPGRTMPADGSVTAAVIATDAIDADAIKSDAVTEIQSGLATSTNVSDAQTAIITQVDANETKIDAIKAKTDNLPSDPADQSAVEAAITAATSPLATAANLATVQSDTDNIQSRLPAALESGRIAAALDSATATQIDTIEAALTTLGSDSTTVERSVSDTNAITFSWPVSGATITGTASLNNGSYGAVAGAIAFLRTETGRHYYTLAYNVADRPAAEGQVRYKFVDGTYTGYVVLRTVNLVTTAQVNAEVLDVLSVDTFAELTAPPAASSSLKDKITWLFMYARNKVTQTAIARTLYRDDTTTVAGTSTTSDNGTTFTKGEDA
jgi:hypothetical protein